MSWLAIELYRRGMIKVGRFKLSSGLESPYYIDLRQLYGYPNLVEKLVTDLGTLIDFSEYDTIIGIATSGMVLAAFIACKLRKPLAYVRVERKAYGTQALVEGEVKARQCLIVDDVATTGSSIEYAYRAIREAGGKPISVLVVVDREQGAQKRIEELGLKFYSYLRASQIFKYLLEEKMIDELQYKEVMTYIESFKHRA